MLRSTEDAMRIKITRKPVGQIEGIDVSSLQMGAIYEVSSELASALLLLGYARIEMRRWADRRSSARATTERRARLDRLVGPTAFPMVPAVPTWDRGIGYLIK